MSGLKITIRKFNVLFVLCIATSLTGCFTGVESTPKISDSEVRRQASNVTVEETFLQPIVDSLNNLPLNPGLSLLVADSKIHIILEPAAIANEIQAGDTLRLVGIEPASTLDARRVADVKLTDKLGRVFSYRTTVAPEHIIKTSDLHIPFCIALDPVETIRQQLIGRQMYVTTQSHYDLSDNLYTGRRFVAVEIIAVEPGNAYYPLRLTLRDDRDKVFRLYLSVDESSTMPRKFSSQLSLTNPRLNYPTISDNVWNNIVEGKVANGMTREECRLALGAPDNVDRQAGYSSVREIWTYRNGRYLVFIDGLLDTFRQ